MGSFTSYSGSWCKGNRGGGEGRAPSEEERIELLLLPGSYKWPRFLRRFPLKKKNELKTMEHFRKSKAPAKFSSGALDVSKLATIFYTRGEHFGHFLGTYNSIYSIARLPNSNYIVFFQSIPKILGKLIETKHNCWWEDERSIKNYQNYKIIVEINLQVASFNE